MTRIHLLLVIAFCLGCFIGPQKAAYGQAVTTLTLSPLPSGTIASGTVFPLVATARDSAGPILTGQVTFFDGSTVIGSIPVVRVGTAGNTPGTATLRKIFGPGGHVIHASFDGTVNDRPASSAAASITVANSIAIPTTNLIYSDTRYFNQLIQLEQFVLADINNDGVLDLIAPQFGTRYIAVSLGDSSHPGAFLPPTFPVVDLSSNDAVAVGDLNGDGLPDIVVSDSNDSNASILFQDAAHPGTFLARKNAGSTQANAQIADMNHDGIPDLVLFPHISTQYSTEGVSVVLADPANPGSFFPAITVPLGDADLRSTVLADMNKDGLPDVILANYSKQTVSILLNDFANPGHLLARIDYPAGPNFSISVGDLNNDGQPDVVLGGLFSGVTALLGDPAHPGQLLAPRSFPVSPTPAGGRSLGIAIGDVDGDGILDVVSGNFGPAFDLLIGRGDGTFNPVIAYNTGPTPSSFESTSMDIADVDGDGVADVLVGQFYQDSVQIFLHQASSPQRVITATDVVAAASVVPSGSPLTINIKVSSAIGPPPGSVTLYDTFGTGTQTLIATLLIDASGSATYTTTTPTLGFHDYTAHFPGDSLYAPSTSIIVPVVVIAGPASNVSLTASPNPANQGQAVTFTATINATGAAPTGSVVFLDGGTLIATAPLISSVASFTTSSLISGAHAIQAVYTGDANHASQSAFITEVIRYPPVSIALTSNSNPSTVGQTVAFTARVTASGPAPNGQITFQDNGRQIAALSLDGSGTAVFSTNSLTVGSHIIVAIYSGDSNYSSQTVSLTERISAIPTFTTLSTSLNPAYLGQSIILRTQVASSTTGTPSGNVTIFDNAVAIGSTALDLTGMATLNISSLQVGNHPLIAVFNANGSFDGSTSGVINERIVLNPQDFTLSATSLPLRTEHHGSSALTVTPIAGLSDTVSLTCSNLPIYATCQIVPTQVGLQNGTQQTVTVNIETDQVPGYAGINPPTGITLACLLPCLLLGMTSRRRLLVRSLTAIGLLVIGTFGLNGCSGKYPLATPPGAYTITIQGHGITTGIDRTTTLALTVTP